MSTVTPNNFFGVLGEDSAASGAVHLHATPKTAESTSSRKSDVNPKADPSKARKRAPGAPSNEKVLKDNKDAGRANNRRVPVKEGAPSHHSRRAERSDRAPRSGKRDTARRERSGWGDNNTDPVDQAAGAEIAREDKDHDKAEDAGAAEDAEPQERKLTLEEFQQQQREQNAGLNTRGSARPASQAPVFVPVSQVPESRKKTVNKVRKEVQTLPLDSSVFPTLQQQANGVVDPSRPAREREPRESRDRKPGRKPQAGRGKPAKGKPGKDGKDKPRQKAKNGPSINLASLPKLNN